MNIEDYREYCLSLGTEVEEKLPFQKFKSGEGVLVFYVMGHMFSFFATKVQKIGQNYVFLPQQNRFSVKKWLGNLRCYLDESDGYQYRHL